MRQSTATRRLGLFHLSWPMFVEELTGGITGFADTLFISMISDEAAASVGALGSVLMLGYFILPQFTAGGTSVASQYIGAGRTDKVAPTWLANALVSTAIGALLAVFFRVFSGNVGLWLGMTALQNGYSAQYLSVISLNFVLVGARYSYCSILASQTLTKWNMIASIVTNVVNIPLNWALMTGFWVFPELGISGVALATVISYFIGFAIVFYMVHVRLRVSFIARGIMARVREVIVPILKVGVPSALEPFSYTMQSFVVSVLIIRLGTVAMAANTYINRFMFLDMATSWSLTMGGQILMSHYLGAGRVEDVRKTFWLIAKTIAALAFAIFFVLTVGHRFFVGLFTDDPEIVSACFALLLIALVMEPIRSMNILGGIALKTVGDGKFSVILALSFMWGLIPVIVLSTRLGFGIVGVWACMLLDETVRAAINAWRWKSGRWMGKAVIGETGSGSGGNDP